MELVLTQRMELYCLDLDMLGRFYNHEHKV